VAFFKASGVALAGRARSQNSLVIPETKLSGVYFSVGNEKQGVKRTHIMPGARPSFTNFRRMRLLNNFNTG
jgi:hypothetical protein